MSGSVRETRDTGKNTKFLLSCLLSPMGRKIHIETNRQWVVKVMQKIKGEVTRYRRAGGEGRNPLSLVELGKLPRDGFELRLNDQREATIWRLGWGALLSSKHQPQRLQMVKLPLSFKEQKEGQQSWSRDWKGKGGRHWVWRGGLIAMGMGVGKSHWFGLIYFLPLCSICWVENGPWENSSEGDQKFKLRQLWLRSRSLHWHLEVFRFG